MYTASSRQRRGAQEIWSLRLCESLGGRDLPGHNRARLFLSFSQDDQWRHQIATAGTLRSNAVWHCAATLPRWLPLRLFVERPCSAMNISVITGCDIGSASHSFRLPEANCGEASCAAVLPQGVGILAFNGTKCRPPRSPPPSWNSRRPSPLPRRPSDFHWREISFRAEGSSHGPGGTPFVCCTPGVWITLCLRGPF